jgi:pSer/pThr/pTyr-binding forkhead associated (FHA) protein
MACEICGSDAPTARATLRQHTGMLLAWSHRTLKAQMCAGCLGEVYRKYMVWCATLGWWSPTSLVINPFSLLANMFNYYRARNELAAAGSQTGEASAAAASVRLQAPAPGVAATMLAAGPAQADFALVPLSGGGAIPVPADRLRSSDGVTVGREQDNDAVISNPTVSRRHARLCVDADGHLVVEDLGSAGGTWRGRVRITRETFRAGDTIRFGGVECRIEGPGRGADGRQAAAVKRANEGTSTLLFSGMDERGYAIQLIMRANQGSSEMSWSIGRKAGVVDLAIDDSRISGTHARVRYRAGRGFEICDLGSSNGTKVDGREIGRDYVNLDAARKVAFSDFVMNISRG